MYWVLGLTAAALMLGFYYLYTKPSDMLAAAQAASAPAPGPSSVKSSAQPRSKRKR